MTEKHSPREKTKEVPLWPSAPEGEWAPGHIEELRSIPNIEIPGIPPRKPATRRIWPIATLLPPQGRMLIYGPPQAGISRFAMQLAVSLAAGAPFLGLFPCGQQRVLYASAEEPVADLKERAEAIMQTMQKLGHDPVPVGSLICKGGFKALDDGLEEQIAEVYHRAGTRVIIFDSFHALQGKIKGTNAYDQGAKILKFFKDIYTAQFPELSFIFLHHSTKETVADLPSIGASGGLSITGGMSTNIQISSLPPGWEAPPEGEAALMNREAGNDAKWPTISHDWITENPLAKEAPCTEADLLRIAIAGKKAESGSAYLKHAKRGREGYYFELDPDSLLTITGESPQRVMLSVKQALLAAFIHHNAPVRLSEARSALAAAPSLITNYAKTLKAKGLITKAHNAWAVKTTPKYLALRRSSGLDVKTRRGDPPLKISRRVWEEIYPELLKSPPPGVSITD